MVRVRKGDRRVPLPRPSKDGRPARHDDALPLAAIVAVTVIAGRGRLLGHGLLRWAGGHPRRARRGGDREDPWADRVRLRALDVPWSGAWSTWYRWRRELRGGPGRRWLREGGRDCLWTMLAEDLRGGLWAREEAALLLADAGLPPERREEACPGAFCPREGYLQGLGRR